MITKKMMMMGGEDKLEQTELYSDHRKRMFFCFVFLLNSTCFSTGASSVQSFVTATTKKDPFTSPVRRERERNKIDGRRVTSWKDVSISVVARLAENEVSLSFLAVCAV